LGSLKTTINKKSKSSNFLLSQYPHWYLQQDKALTIVDKKVINKDVIFSISSVLSSQEGA